MSTESSLVRVLWAVAQGEVLSDGEDIFSTRDLVFAICSFSVDMPIVYLFQIFFYPSTNPPSAGTAGDL